MHEGLAALLALRFTRLRKATFSLSVNDYGIEFLTPDFPFEEALRPALFTRERLVEDILESVNLSELARRQFRDIARVAGLVLPGLPGARKSTRQVQASASLLYDVFLKYDPDNLLLVQARREVSEDGGPAWRAGHDVEMVLIRGNHDRHLKKLPPEWRMDVQEAHADEGPFPSPSRTNPWWRCSPGRGLSARAS